MSSQRSGPKQRSSRKRASILQGVYEENVRTRRGEPAPPSREEPLEGDRAPRSRRWEVAFMILAVLVLAGGAAAYATGGASFVRERLFPPAQAPSGSAAARVPDSVQGRAAPFASTAGGGGQASARPLAGGEVHSVAGLFGLEVKTVVIDPGHGGKKDGAVGPGGTKEKHVALDVARRLRRRLEARYSGYRILMTRTGDEHLSLRARARYANRHRADLFVSVHVNSLPDEDVTSVETYYYGRQTSEDVRRLARRENRASGYSVAAFDRLLEETGRLMRRQESKRLASSIQKSLFRNIKGQNPDVRDWGVRTAPFVVLLGTKAPSVLAEIGVLSNPAEERKLRRPAYRAELARFLAEGVVRYLGDDPPPVESSPSAARLDAPLAPVPSVLP